MRQLTKRIAWLFLLAPLSLAAQIGNPTLIPLPSAASLPASCFGYVAWLVVGTPTILGDIYTCQAGVPALYGGGPSGGVASFNSRTGAVAPASGDYSFTQISGSLGTPQGPTILTGPLYDSAGNLSVMTPTQAEAAFGTVAANYVLAGPTSGSAANMTPRALVSADIPNNAANTTGNAATATALSTLGSANQVWATDPTGTFQEWTASLGLTALSVSGTSTLAAANFSGTATFNGNANFTAGQTATCNSSYVPIWAVNSTAIPSTYNTGIGSVCDSSVRVFSGGTLSFTFAGAGGTTGNGGGIVYNNSGGSDGTTVLHGPINGSIETKNGGTPGRGSIFTGGIVSWGNKFSASGCSNGTLVGGDSAGSYLSGTTGICTVTITMGDSLAAFSGWGCSVWDVTTPADLQQETAYTTTTVTFSGTTVSGDKIVFSCVGF